MRKNYLFFALCALFLFIITPHAYATDYTIADGTALSNVLPIVPGASYTSAITQQIYLASELIAEDAEAGNITGLTFYYGGKNGNTAVSSVTRQIEIWLMASSEVKYTVAQENSQWLFTYLNNGATPTPTAGTKVFEGNITTESITAGQTKSLPISFNRGNFPWNGTSNLVLTVFDVTGSGFSDANLRFVATTSIANPRFVHYYWLSGSSGSAADYRDNLTNRKGYLYTSTKYPNTEDGQNNYHKCVNKVTFSIVTPIPVPTSPSAGSITANSAVLSWTAAAGADSYEVRYGTTPGSLGAATNVGNVTSYSLSELEDETIYYYQVRTKKGTEYSAWTDESSFTTAALAPHIHDGITFSKWASTTSMPTSGNYYLNDDVTYDFYEGGYIDLAGDLNLCLNGHTINLGTKSINVTNGHTMTLFDNEGGGKITGFVAGDNGAYTFKGVISVENGGTLVLREGEVENTYPAGDSEYKSIAVASGGILIISGEPVISSNDIDIFLANNNVITIEAGKPLTNTVPYSVASNLLGIFTSGWANMSGANPKDYFESASVSKSVCLKDGEAALRTALNLSESSANTAIGDNYNQLVDVNLTRSLVSSQFNTFCLPFALSNAQLEEIFGAGYDLEEFESSSFDGDVLTLSFNKVTSLTAGKPYLIQPSVDVTNPSFEGVTISAIAPADQEDDEFISFRGTFAPTELQGGNMNILFLGSGNELFWPENTGNLKGFRAYFEVKGAAQKAAKRARIVMNEETDQALEMTNDQSPMTNKILRDGQLLIERNGKTFNAQGQVIK